MFHYIDTTSPLYCYLSEKYQNRIMIENGRIKKVVASDSERLSIQMEEITGQAFIYARDLNPKETSISVISDEGVVQDIFIKFTDRMPEVIILQDPEEMPECCISHKVECKEADNSVLAMAGEVLSGKIPDGYLPCPVNSKTWVLKQGIELNLRSKYEGPFNVIYVYEVVNTSKHDQTLLECELECEGCEWVFLETNTLKPKQKIVGAITVGRES
jgi:hypothetical protein